MITLTNLIVALLPAFLMSLVVILVVYYSRNHSDAEENCDD